MRLYEFIPSHIDPILDEWAAFAKTIQPAGGDLDAKALMNHGRELLSEVAADMQRPQTETERSHKSRGMGGGVTTSVHLPSRSHARVRSTQGFGIREMVGEYRALRASVLKLWAAQQSAVERGLHPDDVTRFNEAIDQAIAESLETFVAELERRRDLFLGVLGHDLRGPLSTITNVARAQMDYNKNPPHEAAMVLRSAAQMRVLLDDLVEYVRNRQATGFALLVRPMDMGQFAKETIAEITAIRSGSKIEITLAGNLQGVWDPRRLHQALSNLIFNASKYGHPGEPICVIVDGSDPDEMLLAVQNKGTPIPAHRVKALFEPFTRASADDYSELTTLTPGAGMGLGLYVVREVTHRHGGSVGVVSNERFTRFTIRIPRVSHASK